MNIKHGVKLEEKLDKLNNYFINMYRYSPYNKSIHIVIDIESGGTKIYDIEKYSVFSIGSSVWRPDNSISSILTLDEELYFNEVISREDSKKLGFIEDPNVMDWWERKTTDEVKQATLYGGKLVKEVLELFVDFLLSVINKYKGKTIYVWGKAPEFDITYIYKYFKEVYGLGYLFPFWMTRDIRTIETDDFIDKDRKFKIMNDDKDMAHDAYHDSITEGKMLAEAVFNSNMGNMLLKQYIENNDE